MTKFFLTAAAALVLAAPAIAEPAPQKISFTRNGINFVAKIYYRDGVEHIDGHEVETGRDFALRVVKGRVTGVYNASQVEYAVPASTLPQQTASR